MIQTINDGRISHAQLFFGSDSSGALALAHAYAQYISCQDKKTEDACGQCPSCQKYTKLIHPDLHFIYPVATTVEVDEKPKSIHFIKQWRAFCIENKYYFSLNAWYEAIGIEKKQAIINVHDASEILKTLSYKSFEGAYKIMIIWMPEKMNPQAANKILKVLEEPPDETLFILVSENIDPILPTILSRCQLVRIPKIAENDLFDALKGKYNRDEAEIRLSMQQSDGDLLLACRLLEEGGTSEYFPMFRDWMRNCYLYNPNAKPEPDALLRLIKFSEEMGKGTRELQKSFLRYCIQALRDSLFCERFTKGVSRQKEEVDFLSRFSKTLTDDATVKMTEELNKAVYHIERNAHGGLLFQDLSFKFCYAFRR